MPRKVTIDDMVRAIQSANKPCTKQDIANRTGVSRQTIANHVTELEQDERIEHGKVGTATAYWENIDPETPNEDTIQQEYPRAEKIELNVAGSFVEGWFIPKDNTKSNPRRIIERLKPW